LYYRLNVIPVKIPPLRDRGRDIELLIDYFMRKNSKNQKHRQFKLAKEALAVMLSHPWPGNVRELENTIERAVLVSADGLIQAENLYLDTVVTGGSFPSPEDKDENVSLYGATLSDMEKKLIFDTLKAVNGNKAHAAKILGVSIRTIRNKLHEYGRDAED
jgi:transcriptional regulator with PAS, ATPase and Fis domain